MQAYSNPKRETDAHALPDVEVFALDGSINDDKPESLAAMLAYLLIVAGILAAFGAAILSQ